MMKKTIGTVICGLGLLMVFVAFTGPRKEGEFEGLQILPYLAGLYLPGVLLTAIGAAMRQGDRAGSTPLSTPARKRSHAEMGVIAGSVLMFIGNDVARQSRELFLGGSAIALPGWLLLIWGAANYALSKGYSAWFGLFGLLMVPGLIVLACLPRRAAAIVSATDTEPGETPFRRASGPDGSVVRVLVVSAILIVGCISLLVMAGPTIAARVRQSKPDLPWSTLTLDSQNISIEMPENRTMQDMSGDTPAGFLTGEMYQAHDKFATFTIVFFRDLPNATAPRDAAEAERLLDGPLSDWMATVGGTLVDRKAVSLGAHFGRELAIEFPAGAQDHAGRPIIGRGVGRSYLVGTTTISVNVVLNKNDYDRDPGAMEARIARFFDSLQAN